MKKFHLSYLLLIAISAPSMADTLTTPSNNVIIGNNDILKPINILVSIALIKSCGNCQFGIIWRVIRDFQFMYTKCGGDIKRTRLEIRASKLAENLTTSE